MRRRRARNQVTNRYLLPPHKDANLEADRSRPTKYATATTRLNQLADLCGFKEVHIPRAVFPTGASQLGWNKEGRAALGRRAPNSEMPNWYDRASRNAELRPRNDILQKCRDGRGPFSAFTLPRNYPNEPGNGEDSSSADSTSTLSSSGCEVYISDLGDTAGELSGYAASAQNVCGSYCNPLRSRYDNTGFLRGVFPGG